MGEKTKDIQRIALLLLCIITITAHAQEASSVSLNIGDSAPPLRVRGWLKGTPVGRFEKGRVYVVEFWATWCRPCIAGMPHLSALANEYKDRVTFLSIDVYENKTTSPAKIRAFVDSMGKRMDYAVAAEEGNFMATGWLDASGDKGIPKAFVVNAEGRIAWIGHPTRLDEVLQKIASNGWDVKEALARRNLNKHLAGLDDSAWYDLIRYRGDPEKLDKYGKQDSALLLIDEIVRKEPRLKYAPRIAFYTFSSLLQTNLQKAYDYGKTLLVTPTHEDPAYDVVINEIQLYSYKLTLPAKIYELCAEAYQVKIDLYPENPDIPAIYHRMAEWYWRACDRAKAVDAEQKAIETMKSKTDKDRDYSATDLAIFESRLGQYQRM
jgi:thiol-disulfide isomerase/thioredoxin